MDTIIMEMPRNIYRHMQLLVEGKAESAFLKYCTILWGCFIRLYLHKHIQGIPTYHFPNARSPTTSRPRDVLKTCTYPR